jgi:hypothetical protein
LNPAEKREKNAGKGVYQREQGIIKGKYHCTIDLLYDWFRLVCFANKNKIYELLYS